MTGELIAVHARFWRLLSIRWQSEPLASGAHLTGGRWNPPGMRALYLSAEVATAVAEFHQGLVLPGTLAAFDVRATAIADLGSPAGRASFGVADEVPHVAWREAFLIEKREPPTWTIARALIARGAEGALVPSAQAPPGLNLVLWRWSGDGAVGARVIVNDPLGELAGR